MERKIIPIIPVAQTREELSPSRKAVPLVTVKPKRPYKGNDTLIVGFYIYAKCNARCDYCFWFRDFDIKNKLDPHQYKRIVDEVAKNPKAQLLILGGEPTTAKILPELLEYTQTAGVKDVAIGTNFLKPNTYFYSLPHIDKVAVNISVHPDIFKNKSDAVLDKYIDKIIEYSKSPYGRKMRVGVVIDNRYIDRVVHILERLSGVKCMKYPILSTYEDYTYYELEQHNVDRVKPYFNEAFYKFMVNDDEHDLFDDAIINQPNFEGYWCNANSVEVFANGRVSITCTDKYLGDIYQQDDIIKNFNPLTRCTVPICDNFNRVLLKKWKYGKYT